MKEEIETTREKIISLGKEAIVDTLREEQSYNPLMFQGRLDSLNVAIIANEISFSFDPKSLPQAINEHFIAKLGLLFTELKRFMSDKEFGSWLSAKVWLDNQNDSFLFTFNYEEYETEFDEISDVAFQMELETFPRSGIYIPEWLALRISEI